MSSTDFWGSVFNLAIGQPTGANGRSRSIYSLSVHTTHPFGVEDNIGLHCHEMERLRTPTMQTVSPPELETT
jgi:hypothetical protein